MNLQVCDSCKASAPALGPDSAGNWVTDKGSDGWSRITILVYREAKAPEYVKLHPGQSYYAQVPSRTLQLCGKCLERIIIELDLALKVSLDAPDQGDYVVMPRAAVEELRRAAGAGGTGGS